MNVRPLLILLSISLVTSGCSFAGWKKPDPVEVKTIAVERIRLNIPDPKPLTGRELKWIIITPDNAAQVFSELKDKNIDLALFALTDEGYEELSLTMSELRNFISQQRSIILKYKEYYEPPKTDSSK